MVEVFYRGWPTKAGKIALYVAEPWSGGRLPVVVFVHGALRSAGDLGIWGDLLAGIADVVFVDLPGHGRSDPISPATVSAMADAILEALQAALPGCQVLLVGESTGGTIALDIGGKADPTWLRAIFAADPPVTTTKLWSVADSIRRLVEQEPDATFFRQFGRDAFGISDDDIEEIIYYPLIGALRMPTVIVTGDVPLLPERPREGMTCLFDKVDQFVVENFYPAKAKIHRMRNCGHLLLVESTDGCFRLIKNLLNEHLGSSRPGPRALA